MKRKNKMNEMKIGVDLVDLRRLQLEHRHFIERILTTKELLQFDSFSSEKRKREYLGGRYAAKEAVLKAFGTGIGGKRFHDIEILNDDSGEPYLNIKNAKISISHDGDYAIAFVVIA